MVKDHSQDGKYFNPSPEIIEQTKSVIKHNKLPKFIFGQLDQLLRQRPNSSLLKNESFLIYSHNKTREWYDSFSIEDKHKRIEESRKEGKELRETFHNRLEEIQEKKNRGTTKKKKKLEEREKKRIRHAERLTNDVCFCGLWQSEQQLQEGLNRLTGNEQRAAVEAQIKFRKTVLQQKHRDKKIFNLKRKNERGKYGKLSLQDLKKNLSQLIEDIR